MTLSNAQRKTLTDGVAQNLGAICECVGFVVEHLSHGRFVDASREAEQARQWALDADCMAQMVNS